MPNGDKAQAKPNLYRLARDWHGYLSAFAFAALIFFAATGILLNHPGLLAGTAKPQAETTVTLTTAEQAAIKQAAKPGPPLVQAVQAHTKLIGRLKSADADGPMVFARLQGVQGSSELRANLEAGTVDVTVDKASPTEILNGLHRGEQAGKVWRLWIDILAGVLLAVSILGYLVFFSMRFRIGTALILTGLGLALMVGLYLAFVS